MQPAGECAAGNAGNGRKLFVSFGCYQCHGYEAQGGSAGPRLAPRPIAYAQFMKLRAASHQRDAAVHREDRQGCGTDGHPRVPARATRAAGPRQDPAAEAVTPNPNQLPNVQTAALGVGGLRLGVSVAELTPGNHL